MFPRRPRLFLSGLVFFATVGVAAAGPKAPKNPATEVVKQEVKFREADALRNVYVLLATANADYEGQRGKAMNAVQAAIKGLDTSVLQKGTNTQKAATLTHDSVAARAKIIDKYVKVPKGVKEPQAISDLQLRAAGDLLTQVRGVLVQKNQKNTLKHVDVAIQEISIALTIR